MWLLAGHSPASAIIVCLPLPLPAITPQVLDSCMGMGVPVAGYVGGGYHSDLDVLAHRLPAGACRQEGRLVDHVRQLRAAEACSGWQVGR